MNPFRSTPPDGDPPYVIAHRGISAKAPENSVASFLLAARAPGIDMIELDVQLTKDDEVVVLHDRTLQRTTTGNGAARNYTFDEIQRFDAGSWFDPSFSAERVPKLQDILQRVGHECWVNIEIKSHFLHREPVGLLERRVLEVVNECGMNKGVMYSSFDHRLLTNLKRLNPTAITGVLYNLYRDFGKLPSKLARSANATVFVCAKHELRRSMVGDAHRHGVAVYVYTLNSVNDARKVLDFYVDGIISDNADEIVGLVKGAKR